MSTQNKNPFASKTGTRTPRKPTTSPTGNNADGDNTGSNTPDAPQNPPLSRARPRTTPRANNPLSNKPRNTTPQRPAPTPPGETNEPGAPSPRPRTPETRSTQSRAEKENNSQSNLGSNRIPRADNPGVPNRQHPGNRPDTATPRQQIIPETPQKKPSAQPNTSTPGTNAPENKAPGSAQLSKAQRPRTSSPLTQARPRPRPRPARERPVESTTPTTTAPEDNASENTESGNKANKNSDSPNVALPTPSSRPKTNTDRAPQPAQKPAPQPTRQKTNPEQSTTNIVDNDEDMLAEDDTFDQELEDLLGAEDDVEFETNTVRAPVEHISEDDESDDDTTVNTSARTGKLHPSTRRKLQREGQRAYTPPKTNTTDAQKRQGISKKRGYDKQSIIDKYAPKKSTQWGPTSTVRKRYKHHTDSGTVTGRQIQFYRNLNLTYTYDKNKVADLLAPPTDKQETKEQKVRRERLIRQAIGGEEALKRNSRLRITPKQIDDMRFLAMFRYANAKQIAKKNAEEEDTARRRLNKLRDRGMVLSNKIYGTKPVYFLSEEGMILSGYNYKTLMKSDINLSSLSHNFGINHIAACLHGANVDVLGFNKDFGEGTWPARNRRHLDEKTMKYKYEYGDNIVSEYEIQSHLGRRRQNIKGEIYKPKAQADLKMALDLWNRELQNIKATPDREEARRLMRDHVFTSPEMIHENEWMWALFPHNPPTLMHHVPDLVVKRPRNPDGTPNSIAVELELNLKNSNDSYIKTLTAYKNDHKMFKEVVWVSPSATIRNRIEKIAKDVGLWDTGKIRVIPLYYEHGEWSDNQIWLL